MLCFLLRFGPVLICLLLILWWVGFWRWVVMAASFLAKTRLPEQCFLMVLRGKVWLLKAIANEIGRTEREIAKVTPRAEATARDLSPP